MERMDSNICHYPNDGDNHRDRIMVDHLSHNRNYKGGNMHVDVRRLVHPNEIKSSLAITLGMPEKEGDLNVSLWHKLLVAEHSPTDQVLYKITITNIPYCTAMQLRTHSVGTRHFIQSQRKHKNRESRPQGEPVNHEVNLNPRALINISKVRLCNKAHYKFRTVLAMIKNALFESDEYDNKLALCMTPKCSWLGWCPEVRPCGNISVYKPVFTLPDMLKRIEKVEE